MTVFCCLFCGKSSILEIILYIEKKIYNTNKYLIVYKLQHINVLEFQHLSESDNKGIWQKMTFLTKHDELQVIVLAIGDKVNFYAQLAIDSLKTYSVLPSSVKFRHIKSIYDSSTQIVNELGTTDVAVGDATAEIMVTTLGKIPNEMYYLEDTTHGRTAAIYNTELHTILDNSHTTTTTIEAVKSDGYTDHSTLLVILLTVLLIILMICCITACIIARSRSKYPSFFTRSDIECSPRCSGVNQPLLSLDKNSDTTKTSSGSTNN